MTLPDEMLNRLLDLDDDELRRLPRWAEVRILLIRRLRERISTLRAQELEHGALLMTQIRASKAIETIAPERYYTEVVGDRVVVHDLVEDGNGLPN